MAGGEGEGEVVCCWVDGWIDVWCFVERVCWAFGELAVVWVWLVGGWVVLGEGEIERWEYTMSVFALGSSKCFRCFDIVEKS